MKKISFSSLAFIPASHEDPKNPGSLKKVLIGSKAFHPEGRVQMVNWALLPPGKKFKAHYHEDMDEVFIVISGTGKIRVGDEKEMLRRGDAVIIPMGSVHEMRNDGKRPLHYIAMGIALGKGGKTVNV